MCAVTVAVSEEMHQWACQQKQEGHRLQDVVEMACQQEVGANGTKHPGDDGNEAASRAIRGGGGRVHEPMLGELAAPPLDLDQAPASVAPTATACTGLGGRRCCCRGRDRCVAGFLDRFLEVGLIA
mmetsp:Transcript_61832/g.146420  ORF Transcript_61832/g.146420 Transcript_61832/m.146420 type:complete len:126 (+) Transcript_61832:311-688(+)